MRRLGVALAAGALVLAFASIAQAGTLSRLDADSLRYDADPGETNRIFVSTDSPGVQVIDTGATVRRERDHGADRPTPLCCEAGPNAAPIQRWRRGRLRQRSARDTELAIVDGGAGEDELIGGGARSGNWLEGGPGADILEGRATADTTAGRIPSPSPLATTSQTTAKRRGRLVSSEIIAVFGGEGDDDLTILNSPGVQERTELIGDGGGDTLSILRHPFGGSIFGGGGPDTIRNEAKNGLVHGANGDDLIFGGDGPQALWGEGGDDTLRGLDGDDFLLGNRGADIFLPGPGNDSVAGGHGPDTIFARDGQRNRLSGGPGKEDRARVDRELDKVYDMEGLF